jgi:hypothetical protein
MTAETAITAAIAADQDRRHAAISEAARHLYDAEAALHIARQSGAASDRLSEAIADHIRAAAASRAGTVTFLGAFRRSSLHTEGAKSGRCQAR